MILDMLRNNSRIPPERVCIDHVEEHTIRDASTRALGRNDALSDRPSARRRAADMVEIYGSSGSW